MEGTATISPLSSPSATSPGATGAPSTTDAGRSAIDRLNEAPLSRFHRRAVVVSGMGFFTDAYDLFVISTVATLVTSQWRLSTVQASWVTGAAVLGAFVGAMTFGRIADVVGRKVVYIAVAGIMIVGALASAAAPGFVWLVVARFVLGLGIGGDYPVSAVLMSEYSNRNDRGRLVGLVFSMQALGLVVGPLVGLTLLSSGLGSNVVWRIMLGLGALPAAGVIVMRSRMPESPRFQAQSPAREPAEPGTAGIRPAPELALVPTSGDRPRQVPASARSTRRREAGLRSLVTNPRLVMLLIGTAGTWFLFDYAYYGNTLSLPAILRAVDPQASLVAKLAWTLAIFVVFAVPGYALAVWKMDRIGHRRLQLIGFGVMAASFLALAAVRELRTVTPLFLAVFGLSYFFVEFGPNTTTFVLPSEVFPVHLRTTGHGIAAGIGKLGAFVGVFVVPGLQHAIGLQGLLYVAGGSAVLGVLLTRVLPEPARRTLEEVSGEPSPQVTTLPVAPPSDRLAEEPAALTG